MSILSFEEPYTDNEVVGYYEDKLIVKREDGELFFCEIPENLIERGCRKWVKFATVPIFLIDLRKNDNLNL